MYYKTVKHEHEEEVFGGINRTGEGKPAAVDVSEEKGQTGKNIRIKHSVILKD